MSASPLRCPGCGGRFAPGGPCDGCGREIAILGSVIDFLGEHERDQRARAVESFYDRQPFPGYPPGDTPTALIDRCRQSPFLDALDRSLDPRARILDGGCGTAQLAAFLALTSTGREVYGVDASRGALAAGDRFRNSAGIDNLTLLRADLLDPPLAPASFDVVVSRGVIHHTPDPFRALRTLVELVAPGGFLVLGWYENLARFAHHLRQVLGAGRGRPVTALDPILRRKDLDPEKKRTWIADQYRHPLEASLPLPEVLGELERAGCEWRRTVPPAPAPHRLFQPTPEPGSAGLFRRRLGWLARGFADPDAGLVSIVVRRPGLRGSGNRGG